MIGATAFWLAAKYTDLELMRLLAAHGADPRIPADDETTPLMVAAGIGYVDGYDRYGRLQFDAEAASQDQRDLEAVMLAVELGSDVRAVNSYGQTAMHGAAYAGDDAIVRFLADRGAPVDIADHQGQTPLSIADGLYHSGAFVVRASTAALLRTLGAERDRHGEP